MGYNTITKHEPVLKEIVQFNINSGVDNVDVKSTAFKEIKIYKYYGLQIQNFSNAGRVCYGCGKQFKMGIYSNCGIKGRRIL